MNVIVGVFDFVEATINHRILWWYIPPMCEKDILLYCESTVTVYVKRVIFGFVIGHKFNFYEFHFNNLKPQRAIFAYFCIFLIRTLFMVKCITMAVLN